MVSGSGHCAHWALWALWALGWVCRSLVAIYCVVVTVCLAACVAHHIVATRGVDCARQSSKSIDCFDGCKTTWELPNAFLETVDEIGAERTITASRLDDSMGRRDHSSPKRGVSIVRHVVNDWA